jgi:hypothetical protein
MLRLSYCIRLPGAILARPRCHTLMLKLFVALALAAAVLAAQNDAAAAKAGGASRANTAFAKMNKTCCHDLHPEKR